jgi:phosphohistidine phosphatase
MKRRLILTRHAKSSWDSPGRDHDRPLNKRGYISAPAIGKWLRENDFEPDEILSSSARRTVETCEGLGFPITPTYMSALYHASADTMLQELQNAGGHTVLMVGHNPGIGDFAQRIVEEAPNHPRFFDYPTCATTVIEFDLENWEGVAYGTGRVLGFVIPREL